MAHVFVLDKVQTIIPSPRHVILSDTVIPDIKFPPLSFPTFLIGNPAGKSRDAAVAPLVSDTVMPDIFNRESTGPETWRWLTWLPPLDQVRGPG